MSVIKTKAPTIPKMTETGISKGDDRSRQKISDRNKSDTGKTDPGKVLAKMISESHRDQVGNDKAKER